MSKVERLEAIGSRGEAVIILRTTYAEADAQAGSHSALQPRYELATGERLTPTDADRTFETRDGQRRYTLRATT